MRQGCGVTLKIFKGMKIFFARNYLVINDECYGIQLLTTGLSPLQTGMTFFLPLAHKRICFKKFFYQMISVSDVKTCATLIQTSWHRIGVTHSVEEVF